MWLCAKGEVSCFLFPTHLYVGCKHNYERLGFDSKDVKMVESLIILQITVDNVENSDNDTLWTILAIIAAIASAIYAYRSNIIAKKALELATREYNDKQSNFALYLINGYRWTTRDGSKKKFLLFHITATNKSDNKNSFKADLEIEYVRIDQSVARAIIPHDSRLIQFIPQKELNVFSNDIRIEEKAIESKWLIFEQPKDVFKEYRIEKYTIRFTDSTGKTEITESILLKEINNEGEKS